MGPWHSPSSSCRVMNTCVSRAPLMCEARFSLWNFSHSLVSMLLVNKYHVLHISSHRQKRGWFFPAGRKLKIPRGKSDHFIFPSLIALLVEIHSFPFSLFPNHHAQSAPANGTHIRSHSGSVFACDYPFNRLTDWFMYVTINYGGSRKWYLGAWWSGCGHNNSQSAGQWLSERNWGCGAAQPFGAQEDLARFAEAAWATLMMPRGSLTVLRIKSQSSSCNVWVLTLVRLILQHLSRKFPCLPWFAFP